MKAEVNAYKIHSDKDPFDPIIIATSYAEAEEIFLNEYGQNEDERPTIRSIEALSWCGRIRISEDLLYNPNLSQVARRSPRIPKSTCS